MTSRSGSAGVKGDAIVSATALSKWYGKVIGLNQFTIKITPGITGLVGPNGAGKSTFIKLITGQIRANTGTISVLGQNPWGNPDLLKKIGYCPEYDSFYEWMTGREFVTRLLEVGGMDASGAESEARRTLGIVAMTRSMDRPVSGYSKGMRQRIKIAQAIAGTPPLVVLDEPFSGTDPVVKHELMQVVRDAAAMGSSIFLSTHVLHEIEQITDKVVLINQGRVLAEGRVPEIRRLIDNHPHKVIIKGGPDSDLRGLGRALLAMPFVSSVKVSAPGEIWVETGNPDQFYGAISRAVVESGARVDEMYSPDDNLEAVFRYLVKG